MNQMIKRSALAGIGSMAGTLIYTGFISSVREFDFTRALIVGLFVAFGAALASRTKR